jgi:hypothetical protein
VFSELSAGGDAGGLRLGWLQLRRTQNEGADAPFIFAAGLLLRCAGLGVRGLRTGGKWSEENDDALEA